MSPELLVSVTGKPGVPCASSPPEKPGRTRETQGLGRHLPPPAVGPWPPKPQGEGHCPLYGGSDPQTWGAFDAQESPSLLRLGSAFWKVPLTQARRLLCCGGHFWQLSEVGRTTVPVSKGRMQKAGVGGPQHQLDGVGPG